MKTLIKLITLWNPPRKGLLFGLILSEVSLCSLLLLMGQTGSRLSYIILGTPLTGFLILRLSGIGRILLRYSERLQTHHAMFRALKTLRLWFYNILLQNGARGLAFKRSADMLTRLIHDIQTLDNLYLRIFIPFTLSILTFPILIIYFYKINLLMTLIICSIYSIIAFILPSTSYKISCYYSSYLLKARASLHIHALDFTTSLRESRIFNAENMMAEKLLISEEALYSYQKEKSKKSAFIHLCSLGLARFALLFFLFYILYHDSSSTQNSRIIFITLFFVLTTLFDSIADLPRAGLLAGEAIGAAERLLEVYDKENISQEYKKEENQDFPKKFDITFKNISFGWDKEHPLFQNLSLFIPQGTKLALIGPSGVGKSSFSALLLRALTPQQGEILINDTALHHIKEEMLRKNIAWLSQSSHLFDDTIRNNLLLGRQDVSEAEIWDALKAAQIDDFIKELPDGLEQWIGENGTFLSGGQGRRIALARALLSHAPILILDEPATGLDFETECAFLKTLNDLNEEKTIILITHRLLGIEKIDYIWQITQGKIEQKMLS